jgi:glutathione S-transferase
MVTGLRYAYPNAMARLEPRYPRIHGLHVRVASHPRLRAYFASKRRIPLNLQGIFRHYPELDIQRNNPKKT